MDSEATARNRVKTHFNFIIKVLYVNRKKMGAKVRLSACVWVPEKIVAVPLPTL
jgi:hypothetical protein